MNSFLYLGQKFTPLRKFNKSEQYRFIGKVDFPNFNKKDFYAEAQKAKAHLFDIYLLNGKPVVACTSGGINFLAHWDENYK